MGSRYVPFGRPDGSVRVLFFHHAGGSALSFAPLAQALPASCASFLLELPGRGLRASEDFALDFEAAVADLTPTVAALLDRPAVVFGHSLGALIAHAVLGRLGAGPQAMVTDLVVSSSRSPATLLARPAEPAEPADRGTAIRRGELMQALHDYGGCPPELFEDDELLDRAIGLLGRDLHLIDTYPDAACLWPWVTTHIWRGGGDYLVTAADAQRWREHVTGEVRSQTFPGGHFYALQGSAAAAGLAALVRDAEARTESNVESKRE